ncbi:ABC transporter permease [Pseudoflavitalea sp. G-6-1-2]|uniref:ABC transporter permease n=1 Tax=Pseudoflavitalea sp. G-6-1-2 TaxID=2728841 RepID=UPI00146EE573|nr:ABC transporter permease [Pseudoflavitalea sp. G-6-1-2]NML22076.1 ABC transporter permease [Pseudoflavitalea sp. G-6-1-2]
MRNFLSIVKREFKLFFADRIMLMLYLGAPVLYGFLFGYVYDKGKLTDLPIVIVDNDNSPTSAKLIDMLSETDMLELKVVRYQKDGTESYFLNQGAYAVVNIPYRFEASLMRGDYPELNTYINNSNLIPSNYVARAVMTAAGTLNVIKTRMSGKKNEAFHLNLFKVYNPGSNYFYFIWPSYLAIILQSVVMVVLALSFSAEQQNKTLRTVYERGGHSVLLTMFGKLLPYLLLSALLLGIFGIYFKVFKQPFPGTLFPVLLVSFIFIASNAFIGMSAGLLFKSQLKSLQFLIILSMPVYISSGFSWPFEQGGWAAQLFSFIFPFMPFVNGLRILLIEHGTLTDIKDYLNIQLIQLLVYFLIACAMLWWHTGDRFNLRRFYK